MTDVEPHVFVDGDDPSPPRCVVVEGPECGDAAFLGAWLTAAGEAETLWKRANEGPDFIKQIDRVILFSIPDFGIRACSFVMRLKEPRITSLVVRLENEDADDFPMMAEMGFFERAGGHYREERIESTHESSKKLHFKAVVPNLGPPPADQNWSLMTPSDWRESRLP
jgi:hypothetical protein